MGSHQYDTLVLLFDNMSHAADEARDYVQTEYVP